MTTPIVKTPSSIDAWIESWDRQQELYVAGREQRFDVVVDTVAGIVGDDGTRILDLGCGPGALGTRLLDRIPTATYVGVDIDPVLLRLAEEVGARYGARFALRAANLASTDWADGLAPSSFDAIVSSTALHWLDVGHLSEVLRTCRTLLYDGGVFVNADNLRYAPTASRLQALSDRIEADHQQRAAAEGAQTWSEWWDRARADDVLGPLCVERDAIFPPRPVIDDGDAPPPLLDLYIGLLHDAGFAVVDTVWQRFDDRVLVALPRP